MHVPPELCHEIPPAVYNYHVTTLFFEHRLPNLSSKGFAEGLLPHILSVSYMSESGFAD